MALTQKQFDTLVRQLESYAYQQPKRFKQRVFFLAIMGYSYILLILSLLLWVVITISLLRPGDLYYGSAWVGCAFVIAFVLAGIILRSLWVRIRPPQGKKLRRSQTQELFKFVDELAITLGTPKFHNILLTDEFNAAVVQVPRLGIFGWFRNYLVIGLPLMQGLSLEQFRAVIAHEFGHLSGKHSRFATWIYRIHQAWVQLLERLHKQQYQPKSGVWMIDTLMLVANGLAFLMFNWFFEWFVSTFTAYSFVLARIDEYEADKYSADLVGAEHLASALISMAVKTRYLDRCFWREIYQSADRNPQPPNAIALMFQALHTEIPFEGKERWLRAAMLEKTDTSDTHPCLSERLRALGYLADASDFANKMFLEKSAAEELFSKDTLEKFVAQMKQEWQKAKAGFWQVRFNYLQSISPKLLELQEKAKSQTLTFDEKWNLCKWTAEIEGGDAAIGLIQDLLTLKSYYAPANYLLGKILLEKNDIAGIRFIESAASCDIELTVSGYQLICEFLYYERGDTERIKYYQDEIEQYYYRMAFSNELYN